MTKFNYKWSLKDGYPAPGIEKHSCKVFSTFACGGGSTMGYKLAGYDVIGANDIDPQMAKVYKENHKPKHYFLCPIGEMIEKELPEELYNLDIFDGSPPCSTFSMAGQREDGWGKDKQFREGQAKQVLSDLFFDWIKIVDKLKPKVAVAENVKGMLIGNAKAYTKIIVLELEKIGYDVQLFLLNSASMGVPQRRERVFFICKRKDLKLPKLNLDFNCTPIQYGAIKGLPGKELGKKTLYFSRWQKRKEGDKSFADITMREEAKNIGFTDRFLLENEVSPTITAKSGCLIRFDVPCYLGADDAKQIGSFPTDYNFLDISPNYLIGMSVPPVMTAQVSYQIYKQLLSKLN